MWLFIVISPLLLAAIVLAAVSITALFLARPEDVPAVTTTFVNAFTKLVERIRIAPPGRRTTPPTTPSPTPAAAAPTTAQADDATAQDAT
ncbi:hypothetical protein [Micromonospora matsumotoense]|nr:hypothetical protein [Micromonospora matsumotoense]